jgi:hypothetical protein
MRLAFAEGFLAFLGLGDDFLGDIARAGQAGRAFL